MIYGNIKIISYSSFSTFLDFSSVEVSILKRLIYFHIHYDFKIKRNQYFIYYRVQTGTSKFFVRIGIYN